MSRHTRRGAYDLCLLVLGGEIGWSDVGATPDRIWPRSRTFEEGLSRCRAPAVAFGTYRSLEKEETRVEARVRPVSAPSRWQCRVLTDPIATQPRGKSEWSGADPTT